MTRRGSGVQIPHGPPVGLLDKGLVIQSGMTQTFLWPTLRSHNARALIDFLIEAFGFVEKFVVTNEDGTEIVHAQLLWPLGGGVMLGDIDMHTERVDSSGRGSFDDIAPPGPVSIYVVTGGPDDLHDRAVEAGAEIVLPLFDEEYGSRGFSCKDIDGNLWSFGTYSGE